MTPKNRQARVLRHRGRGPLRLQVLRGLDFPRSAFRTARPLDCGPCAFLEGASRDINRFSAPQELPALQALHHPDAASPGLAAPLFQQVITTSKSFSIPNMPEHQQALTPSWRHGPLETEDPQAKVKAELLLTVLRQAAYQAPQESQVVHLQVLTLRR